MAEPLEYPVTAPGFDALLDQLRIGEVYAKAFDAAMGRLNPVLKMLADGSKVFETQAKAMGDAIGKQAAQAAKAAKTSEEQAAALEKMASQAEMAAKRLGLQDEAAAHAVKIGTQYASILRETGSAQSELMKAWIKGLSPAENTARALVTLSAKSKDATIASHAAANAVGELTAKFEDQYRRQLTNVGGQNKLSRSLSELMDQQRHAITVGQVFSLTLETKILESLKKTEGMVGSLAAKFMTFGDDGAMSLTKLGTKSLLIGAGIGALVAGAVGAATAIRSMAVSAYEAIDNIGDLAARVGVSAVELSKFRTVSSLTDVSLDTLADGYKKLSMTLFESQKPGSEASKMLGVLGITSKDSTVAFMQAADAIAGLTNEAEKVAVANKIFGKSGNELLPILSLGSTKIREYMAANKDLRMELSGDSIKAADDYEAATKRLSLAWEGLKASSIVVLPYITSITNALTAVINPGALPIEARIIEMQHKIAQFRDVGGKENIGLRAMEYADLSASLEELYRQRTRNQNALAAETAVTKDAAAALAQLDAAEKARTEAERAHIESEKKSSEARKKSIEEYAKLRDHVLDLAEKSGAAYENRMRSIAESAMTPLEKATADYNDRMEELREALHANVIGQADFARESVKARDAMDSANPVIARNREELKKFDQLQTYAVQPLKDMGTEASNTMERITGLAGTFQSVFGSISTTISSVSGLLGGMYGSIDNIIQSLTGTSLMDWFAMGPGAGAALSAALGAVDLSAMIGNLATGIVGALGAMAENLGPLIDGLVGGLRGAIPAIGEALGDALPSIFGTMISALPDMMSTLLPVLLGVVTGLIDTLIAQLPEMMPALVTMAVGFVVAIIEALPSLIVSLIRYLPEMAVQLILAIVQNLPTLIVAIVEAIPMIIEALVMGLGALLLDFIAMALDALGLDKQAAQMQATADMMASGVTGSTTTSSTGQNTSQTGGSSSVKAANVVGVSDAYLGVSGSPRLIRDTPGDVTQSYQAGGPNDPAVHARQGNAIASGILGVLQEMLQLMRSGKSESTGSTSGGRSANVITRGAALIA